MSKIAARNNLPLGKPAVYDEDYFTHQIPGGMITTLERQLRERGQIDLIPAIKKEVVRVRADLGYPILVTPFSQYVVTQAMMNVLSAERYSTIPDDVLSMVAGDFGSLPGEISPQILEKAETQQRKRVTPKDESLSQLRVRLLPAK